MAEHPESNAIAAKESLAAVAVHGIGLTVDVARWCWSRVTNRRAPRLPTGWQAFHSAGLMTGKAALARHPAAVE